MEYKDTYYGDAYCVKCKGKIWFEGEVKVSDSGRRMAQGRCPECNTKVNRILGATPNSPIPFASEPKPVQQGVIPEPKAYAKFEVYHKEGMWSVKVYDYRRPSYMNTQTFFNFTKRRAVHKAKRWLDAWEVIEFKEKY